MGFSPKIMHPLQLFEMPMSKYVVFRSSKCFPPTGLEQSDNYFSVADKPGNGRLYVGVFASPISSVVTAERTLLLRFSNFQIFNSDVFSEEVGVDEKIYAQVQA